MEWISSVIDKEFNGRYSFFKLLEVNYNKDGQQCLVTFLYPENKTLDEDDKQKITELIKKKLKLFASVDVKYKKSYLDDELLQKGFFAILKTEYPSVFALSERDNLGIEHNFSNVNLKLNVDRASADYLNEFEFKAKMKSMLEEKFCCDFTIELNKIDLQIDEPVFLKTQENIFTQKTPRYEVKVLYNIFGGEITPKPEFIKNVKEEKTSVILAGKIENFEKKSYESKKTKTKGQIKYYYSFELNDSLGKIEVKYFTTSSNEKKMDKLSSGDDVIIMGDIRAFNKKLTLYIKAISKCSMPETIQLKPAFNNDYEIVKPENHSVLTQENLFKTVRRYSEELYKNTYVVFDVETTGLDYERDALLEIGAVKIYGGKIVSRFVSLINPGRPIPADATLINNITDDMVKNCPKVDVVIRDFYRFSRGTILVGYNVPFDQKFIQQAARQQGMTFDNEFIDVLPLAKAKLRLTRYKLTDVVERLEIKLEGAHRALADSLATAEAFLTLNSEEYA